MVSFYQSKGYRDARIIQDTLYPVSANKLKIEMQVFEGNKYYYRDIRWTGNFKYDDTQLSTALGIKKGSVYNPVELDKRLTIDPNGTDISSLYMDDGYLFFNITPIETAVEGDSVDIELKIFEGPQANNNKIFVE
jgi:outer membrane protein insertion porin family